jgi:Mg2+ and Co2+ transporter CorA
MTTRKVRLKTNDKQDMITGWEKEKSILRKRFQKLTDADLGFAENRKNEMLGKLALKLGMTTREIRDIINQGLSPASAKA